MDKMRDKHLSSLSDIDKLLYLRRLVNSSISDLKKKDKAVETELGFSYISSPKRTANNRGGKATTITANAINMTQMYFKGIAEIKETVKYL